MTTISQTEIVTRFPDNITRSQDGTYVVLAQHSIRQILRAGMFPTRNLKAESSIHEFDEAFTAIKEVEVLDHERYHYPAASTAYRHGGKWIVSQIFGGRILVLPAGKNSDQPETTTTPKEK